MIEIKPEILAQRLAMAELDLRSQRLDLALLMQRHQVAVEDVAFFGHQADIRQASVDCLSTWLDSLWLELINCGISHRTLLKLVRMVEDEQSKAHLA